MLRSAVAWSNSMIASWSHGSFVEAFRGGLPHEPATLAIADWTSRMLGMQEVSFSKASPWLVSSPIFRRAPTFGLPSNFLRSGIQ